MYSKFSKFFYSLYGLALCFFWQVGFADPQISNGTSGPSLGSAANNLLVPVGLLTNLLYNIFYIVGAMLLGGSIIRYKEYRENPSQTRLNQPVVMLILGCVFIAFPFIARMSPASTAATC